MDEALFDTTFFIDALKGDPGALALLDRLTESEILGYYSPITVVELTSGELFSLTEETFFDSLMSVMVEVPFTTRAAQYAGMFVRGLQKPRAEAIIRDAMIGAAALEVGLPVYTRNVRDMRRFANTVRSY